MITTFQGKNGEKLHCEAVHVGFDFYRLNVFHESRLVGYCNCKINPPEAEISDLRILDSVMRPQGIILAYARFVLRLQPAPKDDYRRRGVGTVLLNFAVEFARSKQCKRITGQVVADDLKAFPGLLDWYQKRGFRIGEGARNDMGIPISMSL